MTAILWYINELYAINLEVEGNSYRVVYTQIKGRNLISTITNDI